MAINDSNDVNALAGSDVESFFDDHLHHLTTTMQYLKIYRLSEQRQRELSLLRRCICASAVYTLLCFDFFLICSEVIKIKDSENLKAFAATIGPLGLHLNGFLKWSYCIYKAKDITALVGQLKMCYFLCTKCHTDDLDDEKFKKAMGKASFASKVFTYIWFAVGIYGVLHWTANPILTHLLSPCHLEMNDTASPFRILPYRSWIPWSIDSFTEYTLTYAIQIIGGLCGALGVITGDILYTSILMIVCAQLKYINFTISRAISTDASDVIVFDHKTQLRLREKMSQCVNCYCSISQLLKSLQILASPIQFIQCIYNIVVLCLVSFEASTTIITELDAQNMTQIWSMAEYFLSIAVQLFVSCVYASQVKSLSLKIADSMYSCGWESLQYTNSFGRILTRRRLSSVMLITMVCAQKPIILTGGPFYDLSLPTFRSIMTFAISNALILRTMYHKP